MLAYTEQRYVQNHDRSGMKKTRSRDAGETHIRCSTPVDRSHSPSFAFRNQGTEECGPETLYDTAHSQTVLPAAIHDASLGWWQVVAKGEVVLFWVRRYAVTPQ